MSDSTEAVPESQGHIVVDTTATSSSHRRVLITNDDGIDAPGILALADVLSTDFDVTVAAPSENWSGAGTGIGRFDPLAGIPMHRVELNGHRAYALDGPPGLAVMAAALGAFDETFDLVVSGINAGINTGQSVIHSGTVGAALTARTFGSHGLAVSLEPSEPWHWSSAAEIALDVTRWILSQTGSPIAINLNVPGVAIGDVRGLREAGLDRFGYFRVAVNNEGGQKLEFEMTTHDARSAEDGTDTWWLQQRYATATTLGPILGTDGTLPADLSTIWEGPTND
jgi:5'-nucleotidase